jgi:hypothetical protein
MKIVILFTTITLFFSASISAQDYDNWESKEYKVGDFTNVYIEGGYKIRLMQGNENKLIVKADDNDVFDYLQVKDWGDELRIDIEPDEFELDRIVLYITFQNLEKLHIEGGVKLDTKGYLDLDDFELYVAGGAKIEMHMKADDVKIVGEGGVLFELEGIAKSLNASLSGAGHIDADDFKVKDAKCTIEGVGTASVHATETLHARIEGVGKVSYKGHPEVSKSIEGLGSVSSN